MKIVIAGGGVIGASIAWHLQKAGAQAVLLERGEIGGEATGAAAGMLIAPIEDTGNKSFNALRRASLEMYPGVLDEVQRESGIDVDYKKPGMIRAARTEETARALHKLARKQPGLEWLEPGALRSLEPALTENLAGAAFGAEDADLNPGKLANAFAVAAERAGADVRRRTMLTGLLRDGGSGIDGVSTNQGDVRDVDALVLAAGPWTEALTVRVGARLPSPPMRGQMIAYQSKALHHAIWGEDGYLVPKPGGFIWAGASVEDVGFRKRTTERALTGLRQMASELVPALRKAPVASSWAGLRPGSPDGMPVIGRLPGKKNVFLATGHFRNGILLAPITGALMAELVVNGRTDRRLSPFSPVRFCR
ncbi:MAG TPA: glycine oxidase ThiO [Dehalococcoidia bacterium]|nr:glycine oxidase ThiO [Dehalococcoidia bacterium]